MIMDGVSAIHARSAIFKILGSGYQLKSTLYLSTGCCLLYNRFNHEVSRASSWGLLIQAAQRLKEKTS